MGHCVIPEQCRVALLVGGKSGEREVSLASGEGAQHALVEAGFSVTVFDTANKEDLKRLIDGPFDVAFICLHGKYGEDGTIQGFLDMIDLPYTGSGVWSSALAMDKSKSKEFYDRDSIRTPQSLTFSTLGEIDLEAIVEKLGENCVVKPVAEGSALGVYIVRGKEEIREAIDKVRDANPSILVEQFIQGTELTVAVIGNDTPKALPVIEIIPTNEFYDYESKYAPGASQHICPAPLSVEVTNDVQDMAIRAHLALGCENMSRSDFILDENNDCWILETNTIPGMTQTSLLPDAARASGVTFSQLCKQLVELALNK